MNSSSPGTVSKREILLAAGILLLLNAALGAVFWLNPAGGRGAGVGDLPLDDGWIHLVYIKNLATTLRTDYNTGSLESGMSSPLWVLINAALFKAGRVLSLGPTVVPKFLSLLFGFLSSVLLYILVRARCRFPLVALAAALLLTADPRWSFSRAAGMEVTLFASLLLLTFVALDRRNLLLAGISFGLACIARPEGLVLVVLLIPAWYFRSTPERRPLPSLVKLLLPAVLTVGCWATYNLSVTGHLMPNTFYVKAHTAAVFRLDHLAFMWNKILLKSHFFRGYLGILLYLAGVAVLIRRNWRENIVLITLPWLYFFSLSVTHTFSQNWPYYWDRYLHPVIPFFILPVFLSLLWLEERPQERLFGLTPAVRKRVRPAILALAFLLVSIPGIRDMSAYAALFSRNCRDVRTGNVETGKWLKENTQPGDWIAAMDGGAIKYFSERNVLDVFGLNNKYILEDRAGSTRTALLIEQIREVKPAYYVFFPRVQTDFIRYMNLEPVKVTTLYDYSLIAGSSQSVLAVYVAPAVDR